MEDLSFAHQLDHEPARSFDEIADEFTESRSRWSASNASPSYRAASLLDSLSVYAAVFGCSAGCETA